jgi:hypothetical protein
VPKSHYLADRILDLVLRGQPFTGPTSLDIRLFTTPPTDEGIVVPGLPTTGVEVSGPGYAPVNYPCSAAAWCGTHGVGSTDVPSHGSSKRTSNNLAINFADPTGPWGTPVAWAGYDPVTGRMIYRGTIATPRAVGVGAPARFPPGSLQIIED